MFNYHQPNLENMKNYLTKENEKGEGSSINWWNIPSGMSSVRILPPWDPSGRVALPVYMHPIEFKGKDMSFTKYNWTCVNKTANKPCAICEGLKKLADAGVDTSNWEANRRQFYFNAIIMHDPTFDNKGNGTAPGTHVLMKAPKTFYDWIISQITNPMIGDITSITNGIDVYVTKEGTGLGTSYNMTLSPNGRTAIPEEYLANIEDLYNLDEIFSAGFDQEQVNELVDHLAKSAGVMNQSIARTSDQMAGYVQPPIQPPIQNPSPWQQQVAASSMPAPAASPFTAPQPVAPAPVPTPPPATPTVSPMPAGNGNTTNSNLPKCFGQYDPGNVSCVVCPVELDCSSSKK